MNKQAIFKNGSTTYYYSSLFFPPEVKDDVFSLYAFVRTADNYVDVIPQRTKDFHSFVAATKAAFAGNATESEVINTYVAMANRRDISWKLTNDFLEAMAADLSKKEYKTFAELETYMYGSAEVIGSMMVQILDIPKKALPAAQSQGKAMQLINFIRDIQEDIELGRQYLPTEDLQRFGLHRLEKPQSQQVTAAFCNFIHFQIERYTKIQALAEQGYASIPARYRIPIQTASDLYNWTAEQIKKDPMVVFRQKMKPKPWQVVFTILRNYCFTT